MHFSEAQHPSRLIFTQKRNRGDDIVRKRQERRISHFALENEEKPCETGFFSFFYVVLQVRPDFWDT
jgi:hypothetical protein